MQPIFDFHCHPTFKPARAANDKTGRLPDPDLWRERWRRKKETYLVVTKFEQELTYTSQIHLDAAAKGGVFCQMVSFYPLERGFIQPDRREINVRILRLLLNFTNLLAFITGYDRSEIRGLKEKKRSYFEDLIADYRNLLQGQGDNDYNSEGYTYQVVNDYDTLTTLRQANEQKTIAMIISVEGVQAFAPDILDQRGRVVDMVREEAKGSSYFKQFREQFIENILEAKTTWEHPPFIITLGHHFYNHVCGHAESLVGFIKQILDQTGYIHGQSYFHLPITPFGSQVVANLLRRDHRSKPVRRILVDTKHMSVAARLQYHKIVAERKKDHGDDIPIVQTHTALAGRKSMQKAVDHGGAIRSSEISNPELNNDDINLFDDELIDIIRSDGLFGIMLDEKRLLNAKVLPKLARSNTIPDMKTFKQRKKILKKENVRLFKAETKIRWTLNASSPAYKKAMAAIEAQKKAREQQLIEPLKPVFLGILFTQFFHIARVVEAASGLPDTAAWDHICIGSDYEGVINPVDIYPQASCLSTLYTDLTGFWQKNISASPGNPFAHYTFGLDPDTIVKKILWDNAMDFLRKYFHDDYLVHGRKG